ncbi:lipid storage droplets surface-binding protein 1-like isoform X1 [Anthonomus grandis grandis]|uniref:lipid storage droplets surface-binding protein 1-like isoform X1 n=1 Tax=Anthonomus grandis grandis TaxID=2921223 RepID=UPI0021664162|nr:lipid storage droplets surface-binding protein 1-like isoform X1 [Anthonomus grandis grandis]
MSTSADNTNQATSVAVAPATCMESVNRVAKLPVVESTLQTAHNLYEKVKEYNNVTHWTLQTAEDTAFKAVDIAKPYATPVIKNLEGPIKKVDGVLCSGLDYVESKVPAVKLPPKEILLQIYENTKEYVTPAMETAKSYVEPAVKTAKDVLEPAFEKTRSVVEPIVEPIVENVRHKVDEYLHRNQEASTAAEAEQTEEASPKQETSPDTSVGSLNSSTGPDTSS